jgi:hypothetical protein
MSAARYQLPDDVLVKDLVKALRSIGLVITSEYRNGCVIVKWANDVARVEPIFVKAIKEQRDHSA